MNNTKRIAILVIYDKDGVVDDYLFHLLREIKENVSTLVVVVNGKIRDKDYKVLTIYADSIFVRENEGYDATAYKEVLLNFYGREEIQKYDELLLVNDSFYGPFWGLDSIFMEMEGRENDFWGITDLCPSVNTFGAAFEGKILPYHIQSYFLVVRKRMLSVDCFWKFWETLPVIKSFSDAVVNFELRFTQYFKGKGFTSDTYVDCTPFYADNIENNYVYLLFSPYEMVAEHNCPIVKKKAFTLPYHDVLEYSNGQDIPKLMEYLLLHTKYNVDMIWKNLIRTVDPGKLNQAMHLQYILPYDYECDRDFNPLKEKIAVIAHLNYPELINEGVDYLKNVPKEMDIYVTTKSEENERLIRNALESKHIKNYKIIQIGNKGREIRGLLVECADVFRTHEYVCFVHDKRTTGNKTGENVGKAYMYLLWQNMLKSRDYILNIIALLKENDYLGMLVPVPPYHWNYFRYLGEEWTNCFEETKKLVNKLQLNCIMSKDTAPLTLGTTFWCKSEAIKPLIEYGFTEDDFEEEPLPLDGTINHAIERIFAYSAQSQGYATGMVMNEQYASLHLCNYQSMICGILNNERKVNTSVTYRDYVMMNMDEHIFTFYSMYENVYIYGAGDFAQRITKYLTYHKKDYCGYIVSDGYRTTVEFSGKKVITLSELSSDPDKTGIIIAMNKQHQNEVISGLLERGYKNYCTM